jgi:hypothetical protein
MLELSILGCVGTGLFKEETNLHKLHHWKHEYKIHRVNGQEQRKEKKWVRSISIRERRVRKELSQHHDASE